jgi:hypothetical protein
VAVYQVPFPRPVYAPAPAVRRKRAPERPIPRGDSVRGAVRATRARPLERRGQPRSGLAGSGPARSGPGGAVRATFAITPLAAVIGLALFAVAAAIGLVRAIAIVPSVDGRADPRRRHASRARVGRTGQRVGLGLAVIVVLFSVGLIYVDRTVQISARNYDLAALSSEHDQLLRQQRTLENDLARLGSEVAVGHEALDQGLIRLGPPILVPAR